MLIFRSLAYKTLFSGDSVVLAELVDFVDCEGLLHVLIIVFVIEDGLDTTDCEMFLFLFFLLRILVRVLFKLSCPFARLAKAFVNEELVDLEDCELILGTETVDDLLTDGLVDLLTLPDDFDELPDDFDELPELVVFVVLVDCVETIDGLHLLILLLTSPLFFCVFS